MTPDTPAPAAEVQRALAALAHHGDVLQRRLAHVTSLSRSGAGAMVQRLEERGYVQRRTDPADRRLRLVELSADGRERVEREYGEYATAIGALLADQEAEQIGELARLLDGLASATPVDEEPRIRAVADSDGGDPIWRDWG
jgi:DNA-binding MarR family transcriptional regulator